MVSSRNKGSKFLKKPWCSVDGRVWQGNLCLSNLELSPFVRAIELETSALKTLYGGQFSLSTQFGYLGGENARLYCDKQEVFIFIGYQALKRVMIITAEGGWVGGGKFTRSPHKILQYSSLAFKLQFIFPLANLVIPPPPSLKKSSFPRR